MDCNSDTLFGSCCKGHAGEKGENQKRALQHLLCLLRGADDHLPSPCVRICSRSRLRRSSDCEDTRSVEEMDQRKKFHNLLAGRRDESSASEPQGRADRPQSERCCGLPAPAGFPEPRTRRQQGSVATKSTSLLRHLPCEERRVSNSGGGRES